MEDPKLSPAAPVGGPAKEQHVEEPELSQAAPMVAPAEVAPVEGRDVSENSIFDCAAPTTATLESVCLSASTLSKPLLASEMVTVGSSAEIPAMNSGLDRPQLIRDSPAVCEDDEVFETVVDGKQASLQLSKEPEKQAEVPPQSLKGAAEAASHSRADEPAMATDSGLKTGAELENRRPRVRRPSGRVGSSGADDAALPSVSTAQFAALKKKSIFEEIPPNLQAVVSKNIEPLTPTKSLPSRMERMQFSSKNVVAVKHKSPRTSSVKTCVTHFRQQGLSKSASDNTDSLYACQKCSFRTSRMYNLVRHKKADCAFIKDFFSWDANTFTEATEMSKKRSLSPDVLVETAGSEKASKAPVAKRKGSPRKLEESTKTPEKKKKVEPRQQSKQALGACEESSEDEAPSSEGVPSQEELEFGPGDIVWVEWKKNLHWPALVLKILPKKKKARVMLIDAVTSKGSILVYLKKIVNFNNAERNRNFLGRARLGQQSGDLVKAVQRVEDFLRKRCLGSSVGPKQFFWDEVPVTQGPPSVNSDDFYLDALCSESDLSSEGVGDAAGEVGTRKERLKQTNERVLQCIRGGKVNSHLLGVMNKTVPSERHNLYYSNSSDQVQLKHWPWFGPIDDLPEQEEIYEFCLGLLKSNSDLDSSFDFAAYVIQVLCPEAVMKAMSLTLGIEMDKAEEVLLRTAILSKAEREARGHEDSIPVGDDGTQEHESYLRDELRRIGKPEAIMPWLHPPE